MASVWPSGGRHDDVLDLGHVATSGGGLSSVLPLLRAWAYAAYQSHQLCGGATASNSP
ncbi:MAG: hypothetical protein JOZ95_01920 [Solirubrobacterales bacterium]|nr:hypothetical protein [Solirubrobacterales bacterium]MBV9364014.1 hypothetical protein [Solirubrobacterales bacterium]